VGYALFIRETLQIFGMKFCVLDKSLRTLDRGHKGMDNIDSARTSGHYSAIPVQDQPEIERGDSSPNQAGFTLKLKFREYLFELSAQGTLVALALVAILGLGWLVLWQRSQPFSNSPITTKTMHLDQ
jgi:hypothetical protein